VRGLSSSLSRLREYFQSCGKWLEPFENYLFLGEVQVKTVHTTFFMKDYELNSFFYLLGIEKVENPEEEFERFVRFTRKLLKTPPEHYLSTFVLLSFGGEFKPLVKRKSLWLGFKGKVEWGLFRFNGREVEGGELLASPSHFLNSLLKL
jgi:hypothetical protein